MRKVLLEKQHKSPLHHLSFSNLLSKMNQMNLAAGQETEVSEMLIELTYLRMFKVQCVSSFTDQPGSGVKV